MKVEVAVMGSVDLKLHSLPTSDEYHIVKNRGVMGIEYHEE